MTQVRPMVRLSLMMDAQRGTMFLWVPICLALGVGAYFSLRFEPGFPIWFSLAVLTVGMFWSSRLVSSSIAPILIALALIQSGALAAKWRVERVSAPVLDFRYYGPIEGRVIEVDRSASDAVRITFDRVVLNNVARDRTPERVRVSLHGDQVLTNFTPGDTLILTGHLSPPSGPAEPGGFDFQRHAWFERLGAVGYTRTPVLRYAEADGGYALFVHRLRTSLSEAVRDTMPGETGAFAAAIMTGDRSAIGQDTLEELRASNLAHLLAISGLHMGLLTGFIFAVVRSLAALWPAFALKYPVKKAAAILALAVGAFYLALSGGNVATVRAYVMVAVMFGAVLFDRRALSLRSVSIAATIILLLTPEALVGPGFQMSFAATTALVVTYRAMRRLDLYHWPAWSRGILNVIVTSGVAGLATAPIAAAHFNQIAHYGLIANVISVPLMGLLVMPAAVFALCLAPLGLWNAGLWVMDKGLRWILFVAETTAAQPGALSHVKAPGSEVLVVLTLGVLFALLWRGGARWAGLPIAASAFGLWVAVDRADVLVADNGALVGVLTSEGRSLSKARGSGFVAGIWLENDGAPVLQSVAAERGAFAVEGRVMRTTLGEWKIVQVSGKTALANMIGCGGADILVSNQVRVTGRPCLVLDQSLLRSSGAIAIDLEKDGSLTLTSARDVTGLRPWNRVGWSEEVTWPHLLAAPVDLVAGRQ